MLLPELPDGEFGDDVEVSEVASIFLDQMEQDAFERRRVGAVPAGTWFAPLGQIVGLDHMGVRVTHRGSGTIEYEINLPERGLGDELQALLRAFGRRQFEASASIPDTLATPTTEELTGPTPGQGS